MAVNVDALIAAAKFDAAGLLAVIAQDAATGVVRMFAWADADALRATAKNGRATFWSRSRHKAWQKGEESGNVLHVSELRLDCDGDAALYLCRAEGPSCHTGKTSCFFQSVAPDGSLRSDDGPPEPPSVIVERLAGVISARRQATAAKSYTRSLLDAGWPKILAKLAEEHAEIALALPAGDKTHIAHEAADVIFHLLVGLEAAGVGTDALFAELRRRFGTSGHDEKVARTTRPYVPTK